VSRRAGVGRSTSERFSVREPLSALVAGDLLFAGFFAPTDESIESTKGRQGIALSTEGHFAALDSEGGPDFVVIRSRVGHLEDSP